MRKEGANCTGETLGAAGSDLNLQTSGAPVPGILAWNLPLKN
jgi:hypothetical protein